VLSRRERERERERDFLNKTVRERFSFNTHILQVVRERERKRFSCNIHVLQVVVLEREREIFYFCVRSSFVPLERERERERERDIFNERERDFLLIYMFFKLLLRILERLNDKPHHENIAQTEEQQKNLYKVN